MSNHNSSFRRFIAVLLVAALLICKDGLTVVFATEWNDAESQTIAADMPVEEATDSSSQFAGTETGNDSKLPSGDIPDGQTTSENTIPEETPEATAEMPSLETPVESTGDIVLPESTSDVPAEEVLPPESTADTSSAEDAQENAPVYRDGKILIYNAVQLFLIGSDRGVTSLDADALLAGTGDAAADEHGNPVLYSNCAAYVLMNDIVLPDGTMWVLPAGFAGSMEDGAGCTKTVLYDSKEDTVYLYHPYQLLTAASEDAETEPVMTFDYDAARFGMGQLIYPEGGDGTYLTYSSSHRYILASCFSEKMPKTDAGQVILPKEEDAAKETGEDDNGACKANASDSSSDVGLMSAGVDGRDFEGQVIKKIGGKDYILIGNRQQLQAIGSGKKVCGRVWKRVLGSSSAELTYVGDADIGADDELIDKKFITETILLVTWVYDGQNPETGARDPNTDANTGLTYSPSADYIIFRDIDLSTAEWTPITFSGTMTGAKISENAGADAKLWSSDAASLSDSVSRPVISNITVNQKEPMDVSKYSGVGFFATVTNEINTGNVGISAGTVSVSNLELRNVSVTNVSNTIKETNTILNSLINGLGWLIGGITDLVINVLTIGNVKLSLKDILSALLNARAADPTVFATGAFAGRIVGDVRVTDCILTGSVTVNSVNDRTGGFAGYAEGVTQYSGLSEALGLSVDVVASLLNAIPGLGLGDLITVLLGNALPLGNLVPTGYINPVISGCSVEKLGGTIGSESKSYSGGFVGQQIGTVINNCQVKDSTFTVAAASYGGGFAGVSRDAEIKGTLTDVGIELLRLMKPQSIILNSSLSGCTLTVTGGSCLGGFCGALANSYAVNGSVLGSAAIHGKGSFAGGFAGTATVGWISNLGAGDKKDSSLLSAVKDLAVGLLSSDPEKAGMLLSVAGVNPSAVLGCQIDCAEASVLADGSYAGGLIGCGDAPYIAASGKEYLDRLSFWKYKGGADSVGAQTVAERPCWIKGLTEVTAKGDYAGGVAGAAVIASAAGLLDSTLGLGNFLSFTISNVSVAGAEGGYTVESGSSYAGGAVGEAVGGDISNVLLTGLRSVAAGNRAGGFAGCAGPGDLAASNGLSLNLLGLSILKANNLLSVGQAMSVEITGSHVTGIENGFTVSAAGSNAAGETSEYAAGGFIGRSGSTKITDASVSNLLLVTANPTDGCAGGFAGISSVGGLAEVSDETSVKNLISAGNLVSAVGYMIPSYTSCTVGYVDGGGVEAGTAGGFAGDFRSGKVSYAAGADAEGHSYVVDNIAYVNGGSYAGGFGGKVYSGALAAAGSGGGLSLLGGLTDISISAADLLNVIEAYVPFIEYAGVRSCNGFTVRAVNLTNGLYSGSAGGFIGYGSGVQISRCDVTSLKHTAVTPPDQLEGADGASYFDPAGSSYSVTGARFAGGYIGCMDVGSAASVGSGLKILGHAIELTNILQALSAVVSTVEHSDVTGGPGGFSVLASDTESGGAGNTGMAGGFAGTVRGGHIQDCNAYNFSYVIGQEAAGGYAGEIEPGNVADVLGDASILGGLVGTEGTLASVAEDFVPTIRNSSTTCIPCGGAVRAQAASDSTVRRGMAGGYVGHNEGGQIWGLNRDTWKDKAYSGAVRPCAAVRILSVYGAEFAGGYTGLMECADTASTGSLSLLFGLVSADNLFGALEAVYPTEKNTAVYGPLAELDYGTWNSWVEHVGIYGGYGAQLAQNGTVSSQEELNGIISRYVYGYHVTAGRSAYENDALVSDGGCAGGYVGAMHSGVIVNGQAHDAKQVMAMRAAGGFAGEMISQGAASLGGVSILGLNLNLGNTIRVLDVFVPTVKVSSAEGYQAGLSVYAAGTDFVHGCGYAGGYVGSAAGAQIWGDAKDSDSSENPSGGCNVTRLRRVQGNNAVGGYVGRAGAGSAADVAVNGADGLLQSVLDSLINSTSDLVRVLQATVTTVRNAKVSAADADFGFVVDGSFQAGGGTEYAKSAGGFAGTLEAAVLGDRGGVSLLAVENLRGVIGGCYAGGFFGLADVGSVASVSGNDTTAGGAHLLYDLVKTGEVSVLDAFRSYIYYADAEGVAEGFGVRTYGSGQEGTLDSTRYMGSAGGFGGGLMNGSVYSCNVRNLSSVAGANYVGGFIGHLGKNGAVDLDDASVLPTLGLLNTTAGLFDICGSHVEKCTLTGIRDGYTVQAAGGTEALAGGFAGYADLSRISGCTAANLKKVSSDLTAGGFVGRTNMNYVGNIEVSSSLVKLLLAIVNALLKILYMDDLEHLDLLKVDLPAIEGYEWLNLHLLTDGDLLYVNLLGLRVGVALVKANPENLQVTDVAVVTIGDSSIRLPCSESGGIMNPDESNLEIQLIKGNRTNITGNAVSGISAGYDVFGAGADNEKDGENAAGYSGGFVGYNKEGLFEDNVMAYCDVVRGYYNAQNTQVGPFTGTTVLQTVYKSFNSIGSIEGTGNQYSIYRSENLSLIKALKASHDEISEMRPDNATGTAYNRYDVSHYNKVAAYADLMDAVMAEDADGTNAVALGAYQSPAMAVLMADTQVNDNQQSLTPEPSDGQNPCGEAAELTVQKVWKDWENWDKLRPDSIEITIYQIYTDENGITQKRPYEPSGTDTFTNPFTMTADENGSQWSATWKTADGQIMLPASYSDEKGNVHHYTYTVEETPVEGYSTVIRYDQAGYVITVTNRHDPKLPLTGKADSWILLLGLILLCGGCGWILWQKKQKILKY